MCAQLEKICGVDFRETLKKVHMITFKVRDKFFLPTFEALSDKDLLTGCLYGDTQNQTEAINALIWECATKKKLTLV